MPGGDFEDSGRWCARRLGSVKWLGRSGKKISEPDKRIIRWQIDFPGRRFLSPTPQNETFRLKFHFVEARFLICRQKFLSLARKIKLLASAPYYPAGKSICRPCSFIFHTPNLFFPGGTLPFLPPGFLASAVLSFFAALERNLCLAQSNFRVTDPFCDTKEFFSGPS
jgi:hypothetical protein